MGISPQRSWGLAVASVTEGRGARPVEMRDWEVLDIHVSVTCSADLVLGNLRSMCRLCNTKPRSVYFSSLSGTTWLSPTLMLLQTQC